MIAWYAVCAEVDGAFDVELVPFGAAEDRMMGLGDVGRDLAKLEEKIEDRAELAEGDSTGDDAMRSLAGEE